ncbi:MAG: NAD(P)/FAD-dependent oxidoreductase [Actinomycetia bacterium]|nr:NAD(P)/FAD-dependent oxidoreductase [Actinomycetes bacterium]
MSDLPAGSQRAVADLPDDLELLIVGAGLSGIGLAARVGESLPDLAYAIVEARAASGGTWDLFRYPGVRSDSDMFTLSYPFRPWRGRDAIARGSDILEYIRDTARDYGVEDRIHYRTRMVGAAWSTPEQRWTVELDVTDDAGAVSRRQVRTAYLHLASGYYSYAGGYDAGFDGRADFTGTIVHPQFWPEDLDYAGRRVVVIGSGATAVTLVPAMTDKAAHVVMLQRTPSYLFTVPGSDAIANGLRKVLPDQVAHKLVRGKNIVTQSGLYKLSRRAPKLARKLILSDVGKRLPEEVVAEHFQPPYGVWDQRLCAVPDGDFFDALAAGRSSVVTGHIDRFVPEGVRLTDGRVVEADIIVTATGLQLQILGGSDYTVDGDPIDQSRAFAYRGTMLSGVPNASMTVGYINASWTLRADLVARFVVRLLQHLREHRLGIVVPVAPEGMRAGPILDIAAGYVQRSIAGFPKVGDRPPWTLPQSYVREIVDFRRADLSDDLRFYPVGSSQTTVPRGAAAPTELPASENPASENPMSEKPATGPAPDPALVREEAR